MKPLQVDIKLEISFEKPFKLSDICNKREECNRYGIYMLVQEPFVIDELTTYPSSIKYIGKANGETIFQRCLKHLWSIQDCRLKKSGEPKTRPGKNFKRYREKINNNPDIVWVISAEMDNKNPCLISMAEEYMLFEYFKVNNSLPDANTAGLKSCKRTNTTD